MKTNLLFPKLSICSKQTFMVFLCFIAISVSAQNPLLLKSPIPGASGRSIQKIVSTTSGKAFFNTVDFNNQFSDLWGLWVTDGTQAGTTKLILNSPGYTNTNTKEATLLTPLGNDKIIFAGDNERGYGELWVSDGTEQGTIPLEIFTTAFLNTGAVTNIVSLGSNAIFSAYANGAHSQLFKTDGTKAGTTMIYDFGSDPANPNSVGYFKTIGNIAYFELSNGITKNYEIWRTDGTSAGTYQVKDLGKGYSFASVFMPFKNNIYFINSSSSGDYIWKSDGTNAGTAPLKQISTTFQSDNVFPSYAAVENAMILANNVLYFTANDGTHGKELWKTDGTAAGTGMIFDFSPGSAGSNPGGLTVLNNELYFAANSSLFPAGNELFKYDGSQFSQPIETYPGINSGNPSSLTVQNNTLLFAAARNSSIPHFWMTDGSQPNTIEISESVSAPANFSVSGNTVFFSANADINQDGIPDPCIYKYTAPQKIWTGNVNGDMSAIDNWFPSGAPSQTDNVLLSPSAKNNLTAPSFLTCNDFINNGAKVIMQNGLILMNGDFYNEGVIDNSVPGIFGVVGNTNRYHSIGSPGIFVGQFTASSNVIMKLTANTKFNALRIEGADTIYLGDYQLTVDNYPIFMPTYVTNGFGKLFLPVGSSPVTFSLTNPVTITNNGAQDYFGVSVNNGVLKNGTYGDSVKTEAVNRTWDIVKQTGGPANVNITLQWNAADELPGFSRSHVYLNHYTSGAWDAGSVGVASGTGPFTFSRNGITSFSPFSITSSESALPVNLISFTANKSNNAVHLNWQTTSEKNFSLFDVERSKDGVIFSKIVEVPASPFNSLIKNYSFTDNSPITGNNFYRLKMVDADAKYTYSKIIAVRMDSKKTLEIFPNPATNILNVKADAMNENVVIEIIDAAGRKVKEEKMFINGNSLFSIDIQGLPKGVYNLIFISKSGNEKQKFIKK